MKTLKSNISIGSNPPEEVNVIVEIPSHGTVKYEVDEESQALFVDRFLYTAMYYPFNYGYVPQTAAEDGDPIDVLVISSMKVVPGSILPSRLIGVLKMEDEAGIDTKFIAVPSAKIDPFFADVKDVSDLNETLKEKIRHFFEQYKALEPGKWVKLKEWRPRTAALPLVEASIKRYPAH
jgi:inorganic pyrophosphatase